MPTCFANRPPELQPPEACCNFRKRPRFSRMTARKPGKQLLEARQYLPEKTMQPHRQTDVSARPCSEHRRTRHCWLDWLASQVKIIAEKPANWCSHCASQFPARVVASPGRPSIGRCAHRIRGSHRPCSSAALAGRRSHRLAEWEQRAPTQFQVHGSVQYPAGHRFALLKTGTVFRSSISRWLRASSTKSNLPALPPECRIRQGTQGIRLRADLRSLRLRQLLCEDDQ